MSFEGWKQYKLSELMNIIGGGTPKTSISEYWNGDIPWLSVVDFAGDAKKVYKTEKTISEIGLNSSSTKLLKVGQLIISARGTVGEIAMLGRDMAFNQSCYGLDAKQGTSNNFLYYLLKQNLNEIRRKTHGAVFDTITKETFEHISVCLPPIDTQNKVANILSSLDDKIELNRETNQTLEAIAQAIFKEWFVDFNFPGATGEMLDSELGEIPKGWNVGKLADVAIIVTGKTPSSKTSDQFGDYLPFVTPTDFKNYNKLITDAERFLSEKGADGLKSKILPKNSVLVTCIGSDMGKVAVNKIACVSNQQINSLIPNKNITTDYLYYYLISKYDLLRSIASGGSTMPIINKGQFEEIKITVPPIELLNDFQSQANALNELIENNIYQTKTLTQLRDSLLPKLMKVEIKV